MNEMQQLYSRQCSRLTAVQLLQGQPSHIKHQCVLNKVPLIPTPPCLCFCPLPSLNSCLQHNHPSCRKFPFAPRGGHG
ncbi:hypothetical protein XELAEV_18044349mg [Xenopus laevis]|uniref:Uncharacterized protein n=1 Tax=Xenopus laevis TaxID=8355 RepID=A0A974BYR8_XENLA|nr:hypothetical protein XELAEV_18044349mg [Xenopus laevis]